MPELPEVETIKRELEKVLINKSIKNIEVLWPKTVYPTTPNQFKKILIGKKITNLGRRAKMILIDLSGKQSLVVHLKMTGQLIYVPKNGKLISGGHPTADVQIPGKHTRLIFDLTDGSTLYFNDLRKFGWVRIQDEKLKDHIAKNYGPEPLQKYFTLKKFEEILKRFPNRTIKQVLLDQTLIAGIGNIYADEACFLSDVMPNRPIKKLTKLETAQLHKNIIGVLKLSISKKGTSSKNYRRSNGEVGGFMPYLNVYGRAKQKCKKCDTLISKIKHAGRGTHFCKVCQK